MVQCRYHLAGMAYGPIYTFMDLSFHVPRALHGLALRIPKFAMVSRDKVDQSTELVHAKMHDSVEATGRHNRAFE